MKGIAVTDEEKLKNTVEAFCRFIEALSPSELTEGAWGPREVLVHLIFWHESHVEQTEALLTGSPFTPPAGCFADLNARAIAAAQGIPVNELLRRFRAADVRLRALCRQVDPATVVLLIKRGATPRTLAHLVREEEAHIRNHLKRLEKGG